MAEIYKSGRKTYVADRNFNEMHKAARRYFHTTSANILIFRGWEFEDGLYFAENRAVAKLEQDMRETFRICREISLEDTKKTIVGRVFDSMLVMIAPLL